MWTSRGLCLRPRGRGPAAVGNGCRAFRAWPAPDCRPDGPTGGSDVRRLLSAPAPEQDTASRHPRHRAPPSCGAHAPLATLRGRRRRAAALAHRTGRCRGNPPPRRPPRRAAPAFPRDCAAILHRLRRCALRPEAVHPGRPQPRPLVKAARCKPAKPIRPGPVRYEVDAPAGYVCAWDDGGMNPYPGAWSMAADSGSMERSGTNSSAPPSATHPRWLARAFRPPLRRPAEIRSGAAGDHTAPDPVRRRARARRCSCRPTQTPHRRAAGQVSRRCRVSPRSGGAPNHGSQPVGSRARSIGFARTSAGSEARQHLTRRLRPPSPRDNQRSRHGPAAGPASISPVVSRREG